MKTATKHAAIPKPTPFSILEHRQNALQARIGSLSVITVVDAEWKDHQMNEDDLTQAQVAKMGFVMATDARESLLKEMEDVITNGQANDDIMVVREMLNTSDGNAAIAGIKEEVAKAAKKTPAQCFDHLFALTLVASEENHWLSDNEGWGPGGECTQAIKALGKAWKGCLKYSDAELRIDGEFTRPGILKFLPRFAKQCKEIDTCYAFPWK
ncbi:hypothetical protein FOA52_006207 [Chlamydomonas sp. UWO 241]|nr:hypothetical protein FOA52_006207 [Chlamydomonas sp. UWO 241]